MADDIDRAADITEAWNERCIRATRPTLPGLALCESCEEPIPALRRQKHPTARRCVPCQERMELQRGR